MVFASLTLRPDTSDAPPIGDLIHNKIFYEYAHFSSKNQSPVQTDPKFNHMSQFHIDSVSY
jgi:hypothetical protein